MKTITVNKEVYVSKEYIKGKNKDFVLNVSDLNESEGFTQFVVVFDGDQYCCEDANLDIVDLSPFGQTLFVEKIDIETLNDYKSERGWGLDEGKAERITLKTPDEEFILVFYNAHNGYYGHSINMEYLENKEVKFNYENWL